jgi:hypothetical protein
MLIRIKREAVCQDPKCGRELLVGSLVRFYGQGKTYGVECHGHLAAKKKQDSLDKQGGEVVHSLSREVG